MTAELLDGKAAAAAVRADLKQRVAGLANLGIVPGLGTVLVGDNPASRTYVAGKHRDCAEVGINGIRRDLPGSASTDEILSVVDELNGDAACTGHIVQLPLPEGVASGMVLERVRPDKDADGLHPANLGRLALGEPAPLPCTPRGIVELLRGYEIPTEGAHVCIVGRGVTVGRPLSLLLTRRPENATVTLCHRWTADTGAEVRRADIVVAAAGVPGLITSRMVKPGAVVVDVGITRTDGGALVGDVDPEVREVASWLTPVPGGVGPMTRAMLLSNVVEQAEQRGGERDRGRGTAR